MKLTKEELTKRLKEPACSKYFDFEIDKPEKLKYILVNTQFCRYPAEVAFYNGVTFKGLYGNEIYNVTHWAEINDLGVTKKSVQLSDIEYLELSIEYLKESFTAVRCCKIKDEDIELNFERIGFHISNLIEIKDKLIPPS